MNESLYEQIQDYAKSLQVDLTVQEIAQFCVNQELTEEDFEAVAKVFCYLKDKKQNKTAFTLLRLSRLPLKEPKTFDNFGFSQLHGKDAEALKTLPSLSALYAYRNFAFIGPHINNS